MELSMLEDSSSRFLEFMRAGRGGRLPLVERKLVDLDFSMEGTSSPASFSRMYTSFLLLV